MYRRSGSVVAALTILATVLTTASAAESRFFDSDGVRIHYLVEGEGEPVILVHGFTANAQVNWVAPGIFDALAEDYRVIAIDTRGHGRSDKPHGAENYGAQMAKDVINLMDHLGIDKAHVAGYSMGGFITTHLIANYPDRLISAIPGGAGWSRPGDPQAGMADIIAESLEKGEGITPLMEMLTPTGRPKPSGEQLATMNQMVLAMNDPLALAAAMRGMKDLQVTKEQLSASPVAVTAVIGEIDPLKATVDAMKRAMPDMKVVVVQGGDHMSTIADPAYLEAIQKHLARHSAFAMTQERGAEPTAATAGN